MESTNTDILLTYYSSTIRQKDLTYLQDGQWLNDQIMNFWIEHMYHTLIPSEQQPTVRLLDPAASSMFAYCPNDKEELDDMFGPLKCHLATSLIFIPINDNSNPEKASGGSHWTLLVK